MRRGWLCQVALHVRGAMVGLVLLYPFFRTTCRSATGCQQAAVRPRPSETCQPSSQHSWHSVHSL